MASIEEKLLVLSKIGKELNDSGSVWAVGDWREYYRLMGRDAKVAMIDE
ncbi:MAG: hypothetical protein RRY40_02280 [Oscillospiraceae bacterium]